MKLPKRMFVLKLITALFRIKGVNYMIRVLVNGALGRMGGEVCKKVFAEPDL